MKMRKRMGARIRFTKTKHRELLPSPAVHQRPWFSNGRPTSRVHTKLRGFLRTCHYMHLTKGPSVQDRRSRRAAGSQWLVFTLCCLISKGWIQPGFRVHGVTRSLRLANLCHCDDSQRPQGVILWFIDKQTPPRYITIKLPWFLWSGCLPNKNPSYPWAILLPLI